MSSRVPTQTQQKNGNRAKPPIAPPRSRGVLEREAKVKAHLRKREALESRSVLRGLLLLAVVVVLVSLAGAGLGRAFYSGWWRHW